MVFPFALHPIACVRISLNSSPRTYPPETSWIPIPGYPSAVRVSLHHSTRYAYDRPVSFSPHVVRLRPAPHTPHDHRRLFAEGDSGNTFSELAARPVRQFSGATGLSRTRRLLGGGSGSGWRIWSPSIPSISSWIETPRSCPFVTRLACAATFTRISRPCR